MMTTRFLAIGFWLPVILAPAAAGEVRVEPYGEHFDLTVSVKKGPFESTEPIPKNQAGAFVYPFDQAMFADSNYLERIFVLEWKPKVNDKPALGVIPFALEIPVTLRSWRTNDGPYLIKAWSFDGIGNTKLEQYERLSSPEDQWRKLTASLQQAHHYARRLRPTESVTRRAYNSAIDALSNIASELDWLSAPLGSEQWIRAAFERDEVKRGSLLEAMRKVDEIVYRDLGVLEGKLAGRGCDVTRNTFGYLTRRRDDNDRAYRLKENVSVPGLDTLREHVEKAACPAAAAGRGPRLTSSSER